MKRETGEPSEPFGDGDFVDEVVSINGRDFELLPTWKLEGLVEFLTNDLSKREKGKGAQGPQYVEDWPIRLSRGLKEAAEAVLKSRQGKEQ